LSRSISLLVPVERGGRWLTALMTSLDAQTLSHTAFEIVLEPADPDSPVARRAEEVSRRRPNVVVAAPGAARTVAQGDWVLDLGPELHRRKPTLPPDALERIVALGRQTQTDAIVARTAGRGSGLVADAFLTETVDSTDVDAWPPASVVVVRRAASAESGTASARSGRILTGSPALVVDPLTFEPLSFDPVIGDEAAGPVRATTVMVESVEGSWSDGQLVLTVGGMVVDPAQAATVRLSVVDPTGIEHPLPTTTHGSVTDRFSGTGTLDLRALPLADGGWVVRAGVHGHGHGWSRPVALPYAQVGPAAVDGRIVVATDADGELTLDVGARTASPIGALQATDAIVTDSARGTLMTIAVPALAVAGDAQIAGYVATGGLKLPATLVCDDRGARIEAYVSGLAGTNPVATQFGLGRPRPTGLSLDISATGVMSLVRTPPKPKPVEDKPVEEKPIPAAPPTPSPASTPSPSKPSPPRSAADAPTTAARTDSTPLATRIRRHVPRQLDPAVRALARVPIARRVYRALSRR